MVVVGSNDLGYVIKGCDRMLRLKAIYDGGGARIGDFLSQAPQPRAKAKSRGLKMCFFSSISI